MRLVHFSLQNYRSIRRTEQIALGDLTVLVGPNNEGKSNILGGLVTGMRLLALHDAPVGVRLTDRIIMSRMARSGVFEWERDVPISLQGNASTKTVFDFEFELTEDEVREFKEAVKSNLNGRLPVRITVSSDALAFEVRKKGPGAKTLSSKSRLISRFVGSRIKLEHIPAVRTGASAVEMVRRMVESELQLLEASEDYQLAVAKVAEMQQPVLDALENILCGSLSQFLPDVKAVRVTVQDRMSALRRQCEVVVDDGVPTPLGQKGDGVQSVAALSLAHHLSRQSGETSRAIMLAIEEPEAHLHPRAIHALRRVLQDISKDQQVVVTTHSPLLTNRSNIRQNVVVHRNRARAATSLADVRDVLGVEVSDNLASAALVLLVEGETDVQSIGAVLRARSRPLDEAVRNGQLVVTSMRGVRNLANQLTLLRGFLCAVHVFIDYDQAGRDAEERARKENLLEPSEVNFAMAVGMRDSEVEDLFDTAVYEQVLANHYGVTFPTPEFKARRARWSDRVNRVFQASGQTVGDITAVKHAVARAVAEQPAGAVASTAESVVDALIANLERRLSAHVSGAPVG